MGGLWFRANRRATCSIAALVTALSLATPTFAQDTQPSSETAPRMGRRPVPAETM